MPPKNCAKQQEAKKNPCFESVIKNKLRNTKYKKDYCSCPGSNRGPFAYQTNAIPTSPHEHFRVSDHMLQMRPPCFFIPVRRLPSAAPTGALKHITRTHPINIGFSYTSSVHSLAASDDCHAAWQSQSLSVSLAPRPPFRLAGCLRQVARLRRVGASEAAVSH